MFEAMCFGVFVAFAIYGGLWLLQIIGLGLIVAWSLFWGKI